MNAWMYSFDAFGLSYDILIDYMDWVLLSPAHFLAAGD